MEKFEKRSEGVFYTKSALTVIGREEVEWLKNQVGKAPLSRARICMHPDVDSSVHEMFIVHKASGYVQPHRHLGKSESIHVIQGRAALLTFSPEGDPLATIQLGGEGALYYRMENSLYHSFVFLTEFFVFHEVVQGPFRSSDTEFAEWAPSEQKDSIEVIQGYQEELAALQTGKITN